jgi:hypothetical protein
MNILVRRFRGGRGAGLDDASGVPDWPVSAGLDSSVGMAGDWNRKREDNMIAHVCPAHPAGAPDYRGFLIYFENRDRLSREATPRSRRIEAFLDGRAAVAGPACGRAALWAEVEETQQVIFSNPQKSHVGRSGAHIAG